MKTMVMVVMVFIASGLCLAGTVSAELSEMEQKLLRKEATRLAKEKGLGEDELYRTLALSYLGQQAEKVASSNNPVEAEHGKLRAAVYNGTADATIKIALSLKSAKEVIAALEAEQAANSCAFVSPELSRRINGVGALGIATIHAVSTMNAARVNLASFEATLGCNSKQAGYVVKCLESLRQAVDEISSAMDLLKKVLEPIVSVSLLSTGRHFKY